MKNTFLSISLAALLTTSAAMASVTPLLQDGTQSLYQRVLTTPSCSLLSAPGEKNGSDVNAFSRFYVYAKEGGYLKVGPDTTGKISGYLLEECTVPWRIQTALLFNNPASRDRAIIFDKYDTLADVMALDDPKGTIDPIKEKAYKGQSAPGVIAVEPETYVNFHDQFYLLPILESSESMFADGSPALELKVASVTADAKVSDTSKNTSGSSASAVSGNAITAFKAGIVFVVDASISMQPYIDRTKQAINAVVSKLQSQGLEDYVQFGLVSFRSNTRAVPALEYESKTFLKPGEALTVSEFNEKLRDLKQATVSSKLFDEDAYSGISRALNDVNWDEFGGRYIVLITDAGAIEGSNELSSTHLDAAQLASEAEKKKAAIFTLHLLTSAGRKNHAKARAQYQTLSYNNAIQDSLYESINAGSVDEFGQKIDHFADTISKQVRLASEGKVGAGSAALDDSSDDMDKKLAKLGYAMQLYYLGDTLGTSAPDFIQGWMADRDLVDHTKAVVEPVVLMTKSELADLYDLVSEVKIAVDERALGAADSFASLRELALKMGSDPDKVKDKKLNLTQMGLIDEYLAALPYKSRIAEIDEETWNSLSPQEQDSIYRDLSSKLEHYKIYDSDSRRWVSLSEGASDREKVYPVPLKDLP